MRNLMVLLMVAACLAACSHGKTKHFPAAGNPTDYAEITVLRDGSIWGLGFSMGLLLNGETIARMRPGEHISFFVPPGMHAVGITQDTMTLYFDKGQQYYFGINPGQDNYGFVFEQLDPQGAQRKLADSKHIE